MYKKDDLFYKIDLLPSQRTSINFNIKYKFREGVRRRGEGQLGDMFAINSIFSSSKTYCSQPIKYALLPLLGNHMRTLVFQRLPWHSNPVCDTTLAGQPSAYLSVPKVTLLHRSTVTALAGQGQPSAYLSVPKVTLVHQSPVTALAGQPYTHLSVPKVTLVHQSPGTVSWARATICVP